MGMVDFGLKGIEVVAQSLWTWDFSLGNHMSCICESFSLKPQIKQPWAKRPLLWDFQP